MSPIQIHERFGTPASRTRSFGQNWRTLPVEGAGKRPGGPVWEFVAALLNWWLRPR